MRSPLTGLLASAPIATPVFSRSVDRRSISVFRPACSTYAGSAKCSRASKAESHKALDHVSPLAVPVMLEIGREQVYGEAADVLLAETEAELVKEAMQ